MMEKDSPAADLAFHATERFLAWTRRDPVAMEALRSVEAGQLRLLFARFRDMDEAVVMWEFETLLDGVLKERIRKTAFTQRKNPLERVLCERICEMFPAPGALTKAEGSISRRLLPGLFQAVEMMIGHDDLAERRQRCNDTLERLLRNENGDAAWETLCSDDEVNDMIDDVLARGLAYFDSTRKRIDWFQRLINGNLAKPGVYEFEGEASATWALDNLGTKKILAALYAPLISKCENPHEIADLEARHGKLTVAKLTEFLNTLQPPARRS